LRGYPNGSHELMKPNRTACLAPIAGLILLASAPGGAQATLTYENINGVNLIHDSLDNLTWTRDGNVAAQAYTWQAAQTWAAGLNLAGVGPGGWQIATGDQFTSLYNQLAGPDHGNKYGSQVQFMVGTGPNDYASNVQPEYWTAADGIDFNFYYGYSGVRPDTDVYSVWAVAVIPEPSTCLFGCLALGLAPWLGFRKRRSTFR